MEEKVLQPATTTSLQTAPISGAVNHEVKELLEKNLKWSQIIYEQNRRINRRLWWLEIGGWVKILFVIVPIIIGILYVPILARTFMSRYRSLLVPGSTAAGVTPLETILKSLPLDRAQQDQLRRLFK